MRYVPQRVHILEELVELRDVHPRAATPPVATMVERVDGVSRSGEAGADVKVAPGMLGEAVQDEANRPRLRWLPRAKAETQSIAGDARSIDGPDRHHETGTLAGRGEHVKPPV